MFCFFQKYVFKQFSDIAGNVTHRVLLTQVSITLGIQYCSLQSMNLVYFNSPGVSVLQDFWKDGWNRVGMGLYKIHCVCWAGNSSIREALEIGETLKWMKISYPSTPLLVWAMLKQDAAECLQPLLNTSHNENNSFQRDIDFYWIICV